MATAPTTEKKAKRKQGPRNSKPKEGFVLFKGQIDGDIEVVMDGGAALVDRILADRDLKVVKFVVPVKARRATSPEAPAV